MPLAVASGLAVEARIAAGPGVRCVVASGEPLREALRREAGQGARALLSFGLAGGLAPGLRGGDWVIGGAVVTTSGRWIANPAWVHALAARLPAAQVLDVAGSDWVVAEPRAKAALHAVLGAAVVDMESHVVAQVAAERGLPFAVLRVVVDPAERRLPPAARIDLAAGGRFRWPALLRSLLAEPGQIPALLGLAVEARRALRSLSGGRGQLRAGPAGPDFGQLVLDVP